RRYLHELSPLCCTQPKGIDSRSVKHHFRNWLASLATLAHFHHSSSMADIPIEIFKIENFAPGIAMFSLSFIALFSGNLLANDRSSSFLARLFASPLTARDYIVGYS